MAFRKPTTGLAAHPLPIFGAERTSQAGSARMRNLPPPRVGSGGTRRGKKETMMQSLRNLALGAAVSSLLASSALAADLGSGPPRANSDPYPHQAPFTWTGLYVGAHLGYGWSDVDWQEAGFDGSHSGEGALAGGQIGYNIQVGKVVYGVEADMSGSFIDGGNSCCGHTVNWLASARGRLGFAGYDSRMLFYATAGAAWADIEYSGSVTETHFGWVAGGGVERAFTPNLTGRIEYLYYGFDSVDAAPGTVAPGTADLEPSVQTVRLGLNFKF
jgi:outer membrane immunogenic protein